MAVVDLETTGFPGDPAATILEFGALLLDPDSDEITIANTLLCQEAPIPAPITRLTGLRDEDLRGAPRLAELASELRSALRGRTLIAHNADFERFFLDAAGLASPGAPADLDTQDLLALCHPDAPDLRLESFTRLLLGREERHRALDDAIDTAAVLSAIAVSAAQGVARYALAHDALERFAPGSPWAPLIAGLPSRTSAPPPTSLPSAPSAPETPVPFDEEAIVAALRDAARGARHFDGYRVREEQVTLARSVVRALRDGEVLLLEGGTGVGKSLAYLAALIPWSVEARESASPPVVISTRTKLLQDQLLEKDIPAAAAFLGYPELGALSIKGRANYACERRLAAALADGLEAQIFPEDRFAYAILASSAAIRPGGEVAALPGAWLRRYPALVDLLRRSVAARAEQCTREECAKHPGCALGARRSALSNAHLVVANHDLLLRWPSDYPDFRHVVVDEAHELSAVADEVYAEVVRPSELIERLDDLFGRPSGEGGGLLPAGKRRAFRRDALAWRRALAQDFVALGRALEPRASEFGEVQIPASPGAPEDGDFVDDSFEDLRFADAIAVADAAAARLEHVAQQVESELDGPPDAAQTRNLDDLRAAAAALRRAFAGSEDAVASFQGVVPPYDTWTLAVRPLSLAPAFREALLDRVETFVGVSASLLIAGTAFAALGELEIEESAGERLVRVSVPSPFPYAEQMRVVALRDPGDLVTLTAEAIERLALPLGGRTLGLFTSLRRMREVADQLVPVLREQGIDVISPRRASDDPSALLERFRRGRAVLLGARKFWQGVDLPGDALQAVVIEKLPFEVPTELRRRREARLRRAGRDPFSEATLGKMLLNLKQMAGRLIRSEEDRGVVVLVEGRSDRRYFRRLAEALPPGCPLEIGEIRNLDAVLKELGLPER